MPAHTNLKCEDELHAQTLLMSSFLMVILCLKVAASKLPVCFVIDLQRSGLSTNTVPLRSLFSLAIHSVTVQIVTSIRQTQLGCSTGFFPTTELMEHPICLFMFSMLKRRCSFLEMNVRNNLRLTYLEKEEKPTFLSCH